MKEILKKNLAQEEFFDHAIGSGETSVYTVQIDCYDKQWYVGSTRYIRFPREIASALHLEAGKSVKWSEQDSKSLTMTPLSENTMQAKVTMSKNNLKVVIPPDMLAAGGLKLGDYVSLAIDDGCLSVRKAEGAGVNAVKIWWSADSPVINIPVVIAADLGLEKGMFALWQFDKRGLWIKFQKEDSHLATILEYGLDYPGQLSVHIPEGIGTWIKKYEYAALQVKEKKLYIWKNEPQGLM